MYSSGVAIQQLLQANSSLIGVINREGEGKDTWSVVWRFIVIGSDRLINVILGICRYIHIRRFLFKT